VRVRFAAHDSHARTFLSKTLRLALNMCIDFAREVLLFAFSPEHMSLAILHLLVSGFLDGTVFDAPELDRYLT
jgi:hypothetical protein